jgi:septal ring factor EnvC (AmiA/AmiB activator)
VAEVGDLDIANIASLVLGLIAGAVGVALVLPSLNRRMAARHQAQIDQYERLVVDLRRECADDRETNRRLRHQLAISTPQNLEHTKEERDSAIEELEKLHTELRETTLELANRDRSLREARMAIHDIRVELERNRFAAEAAGEAREQAAREEAARGGEEAELPA